MILVQFQSLLVDICRWVKRLPRQPHKLETAGSTPVTGYYFQPVEGKSEKEKRKNSTENDGAI
jgi:hypothetical protein